MNKQTENILKLILAISMLVLTVGCGSSKTADVDSIDFGSNDPGATTKPVATCSQDVTLGDLRIKAMVMVNAYGQVDTNQIRFKFASFPSGFTASDWDFQVRQWAVDSSGNSVLTNPLSFYFERKVSYGYETISANQYNILNMAELRQMSAYVGGPTTDTGIRDYFNFRISSGSSNYQVLRITMRLKNNGAIQKEADVLMPSFYAKPTDFKAYRPSLFYLHPMKDRLSETWSDSQWKGFTDAFCF